MSTHDANGLMALGIPGGPEWLVLLVLGLLIFGRRLPDIARSIGKSIVEFKKGVRDVEGEIEESSRSDRQDRTLPPSKDAAPQRNATLGASDMREHNTAKSTDAGAQPPKTHDSDVASG